MNHLDAMECLEETMTMMMMKAKFCEFYADIYEGSQLKTLQDTLFSALPQFHASVIVSSIKTREYFHARCKLLILVLYHNILLLTSNNPPPTRDYKNSKYVQAF